MLNQVAGTCFWLPFICQVLDIALPFTFICIMNMTVVITASLFVLVHKSAPAQGGTCTEHGGPVIASLAANGGCRRRRAPVLIGVGNVRMNVVGMRCSG